MATGDPPICFGPGCPAMDRLMTKSQLFSPPYISESLPYNHKCVQTTPGHVLVPVQSLPPYTLLKPFYVSIEPSHGDGTGTGSYGYIACWYDAGISDSGCNQTEAFSNLINKITTLYDLYIDPPDPLSDYMEHQLYVMREFISAFGVATGTKH